MFVESEMQPLRDLDRRLREAQTRQPRISNKVTATGMGLAFRIGIELVAALVVGVGIGWLLDVWLDTKPWLMVVFFFLGAGAGILNVYRTVSSYGLAGGYRKAAAEDGKEAGDR